MSAAPFPPDASPCRGAAYLKGAGVDDVTGLLFIRDGVLYVQRDDAEFWEAFSSGTGWSVRFEPGGGSR